MIFTFGKYKGLKPSNEEVTNEYLYWVYKNVTDKPEIVKECEKVLNARYKIWRKEKLKQLTHSQRRGTLSYHLDLTVGSSNGLDVLDDEFYDHYDPDDQY